MQPVACACCTAGVAARMFIRFDVFLAPLRGGASTFLGSELSQASVSMTHCAGTPALDRLQLGACASAIDVVVQLSFLANP